MVSSNSLPILFGIMVKFIMLRIEYAGLHNKAALLTDIFVKNKIHIKPTSDENKTGLEIH